MRLGVDVGTVRIGVAASDPDGLIAFPVATVQRGEGDVAEVAALAHERQAARIFVGLPRKLSGKDGDSVAMAQEFASALSERCDAVVRLVDERFSTASAQHAMRQAGRTAKQQRQVIDQAAAVVILETALDIERQGNLDRVTYEPILKGNDD
ncbi:Holliday junction resolvase RuvX [uncultured Demequina sp.]|uniref:Holliday junction resolvase RuvX n=1 Tax=uncultured Demequina sp. TaxID=693499 RepID=UPI00345C15AB